MYYIDYLFDMEANYMIGGILLGVVAILCGGAFALSFFLKKNLYDLIGIGVSALSVVVASLFCYNELVLVAFWIALIALAYFMTRVCQTYHKKTIYEVPFWKLYFRMFFPLLTSSLLFRPWFSTEADGWYRIFPGFGMNVSGVYVYDVMVLNASKTDTVWNIISVVEILLFVALLLMQAILIWREFADPDNAYTWATIGMIVTCIGAMFVYGVYTSPNFLIATTMESAEKLNLATGQFETVFKPVQATVDNVTMAPVIVVLSGVANRLFYFERRK